MRFGPNFTAAEHFAACVERALAELDEPGRDPERAAAIAHGSFCSDLDKHPGTAVLMTRELQMMFVGEYLAAGAVGVRRFITGMAGPKAPVQ